MSVMAPPGPAAKPRRFIKFNATARAAYLKAIEDGCSMTEAAAAIGLDRTTVWAYRKQHPEFEEQIFEAERASVAVVESALFEQCRKGNVRAIEFYLCNRAPERWSDRRNVELKANMAVEQRDPLPAVLETLDAHPDAKAELIKRIEMTSP